MFFVVCDKTINLTRMGKSALCGNQTSGKDRVKSFFKREGSEDCTKTSVSPRRSKNVDTGSREDTVMSITPPPAMNPSDVTSFGKAFSQFFSKSDVIKPEVRWTSSKNYSHCSYNSIENINKIFRAVSELPNRYKVYPRFKDDILSLCSWRSGAISRNADEIYNWIFYDSFLMRG